MWGIGSLAIAKFCRLRVTAVGSFDSKHWNLDVFYTYSGCNLQISGVVLRLCTDVCGCLSLGTVY